MESIEVETGPNPSACVIWMHGLGADGHDFVPIVPELRLPSDPPIRFLFPHAPTMPVTINGGMVMRAWYDILGTDLVRREDESGLRRSQDLVEELIAAQNARGIASRRIVLAGFSQGAAMALQTGLRHAAPLAGLMCLSGYLPLAALTEAERHASNTSTPIFMAHGQLDPVIPINRAAASREALSGLGYRIEWHDYMMPHSVCPEEIIDIGRWLTKVLGLAC
ncbi:MAG: alpha/beta hydrolase [Burkholderiaceae bacterium]|jgi:phospholipase/carboxylesterase